MGARNAFYAQSGGVTAVLNASAAGVIETARRHRGRIGTVYAGRDGILGALTEDLIDTGRESAAAIRALTRTPGGAFGSCRYDLGDHGEQRAHYERLLAVFRAHDIGYFFYNGGNGSADTSLKVAQYAARAGYPLACIHVPKTIDNDIAGTDTCPGFGSAARYVATSMREAAFDVASMARTSTRVFVMEVMGRNAGWVTLAAGMADDEAHPLPLLLVLPEWPLDIGRLLARVDRLVRERGYCCLAVSEGLRSADGGLLSARPLPDAPGHTQLGGSGGLIAELVHERLGHKYHWALADYLQRSARHLASRTDLEQAYAVGQAAVELALAGTSCAMVSIVRRSDRPYRWSVGSVPLGRVVGRERRVPRAFLSADGFGITARARRYLQPLMTGDDPPKYVHGLPQYVQLRRLPVPRRLATYPV